MERVEIKDNPMKLEIYINGKPDISLMPKEIKDVFINSLADKLSDYMGKKKVKKE